MVEISLEQRLLSNLNCNEFAGISDAPDFEYKSIFFHNIVPDPTNARYIPAIMISDSDAKLFVNRKVSKMQLVKAYEGENHVLYGKDCFINCLKYGSNEWKKANETIESILDLANNIAVSEVIQVPTIYPVGENYQILTGHRRFFALVYVKGANAASQFKVYKTAPLLKKTKQFQENASREDLPQYGKLASFQDAQLELEALNQARLKMGLKKLTVREQVSILGISMGAFDNYTVLVRYPCVIDAYQSGLILSFIRLKKIILEIEETYRKAHDKSTFNVTDRRNINEEIKHVLSGKRKAPVQKSHPFRLKPLNSVQSLRRLLEVNVFELDTGIDWEGLEWQNTGAVNKALESVIEHINNNAAGSLLSQED